MIPIRILITVVASVSGLIIGGLVAGLVGVLLIGVDAYCHAFQSRPWGFPTWLSVVFCITCALVTGFLAWRASVNWIKRFFNQGVTPETAVSVAVSVNGLVTVGTFWNVGEAYLAMSALENTGVQGFLENEYTVLMEPQSANPVGVKLNVRQSDAQRAIEVLKIHN